jgi:hypothetical protein
MSAPADESLVAAITELVRVDPSSRPLVLSVARGDRDSVIELADRVRKVRTQEGVKRYGAPIGTPITPGMARRARERDTGSDDGGGDSSSSSGKGSSGAGPSPSASSTSSSSSTSSGKASGTGKGRSGRGAAGDHDTGGAPDLSTPRGAMAAIKGTPKVSPDPNDRDTQIARAAQLAASTRHPQVIFRRDDGSVQVGIASRNKGHEGRKKVLVQPNGQMFNVDEDGNKQPIPHDAVARVLAKYVQGADPGDHAPSRDRGSTDVGGGPVPGAAPPDRERDPASSRSDRPATGSPDQPAEAGTGEQKPSSEAGTGAAPAGEPAPAGAGTTGGTPRRTGRRRTAGARPGRTADGQIDTASAAGLVLAAKATPKVPRSRRLERGTDEGLAGVRALQLSASTRWKHKVWYDTDGRIKVTKGPNTPPEGTPHTLVQPNGRMFDVDGAGRQTEIPHGDVLARVGPHLGHQERSPMTERDPAPSSAPRAVADMDDVELADALEERAAAMRDALAADERDPARIESARAAAREARTEAGRRRAEGRDMRSSRERAAADAAGARDAAAMRGVTRSERRSIGGRGRGQDADEYAEGVEQGRRERARAVIARMRQQDGPPTEQQLDTLADAMNDPGGDDVERDLFGDEVIPDQPAPARASAPRAEQPELRGDDLGDEDDPFTPTRTPSMFEGDDGQGQDDGGESAYIALRDYVDDLDAELHGMNPAELDRLETRAAKDPSGGSVIGAVAREQHRQRSERQEREARQGIADAQAARAAAAAAARAAVDRWRTADTGGTTQLRGAAEEFRQMTPQDRQAARDRVDAELRAIYTDPAFNPGGGTGDDANRLERIGEAIDEGSTPDLDALSKRGRDARREVLDGLSPDELQRAHGRNGQRVTQLASRARNHERTELQRRQRLQAELAQRADATPDESATSGPDLDAPAMPEVGSDAVRWADVKRGDRVQLTGADAARYNRDNPEQVYRVVERQRRDDRGAGWLMVAEDEHGEAAGQRVRMHRGDDHEVVRMRPRDTTSSTSSTAATVPPDVERAGTRTGDVPSSVARPLFDQPAPTDEELPTGTRVLVRGMSKIDYTPGTVNARGARLGHVGVDLDGGGGRYVWTRDVRRWDGPDSAVVGADEPASPGTERAGAQAKAVSRPARPAPFTPEQSARGGRTTAQRRRGEEHPDDADDRAAREAMRPPREPSYNEDADEWRREARQLGENPSDADVAARVDEWDGGQIARLNRARRELGMSPVAQDRETINTRPGPAGQASVRREVADARAGKARAEVLGKVSDADLDEIERVETEENRQRGRGSNAPSDRRKRSAYEKRERIIRDVRAERDRRAAAAHAPAAETAGDAAPSDPAGALPDSPLRDLYGQVRQLQDPEVRQAVDLSAQLLAGRSPQDVADHYGGDRAAAARRVGEFARIVGDKAPGGHPGAGADHAGDVHQLARALERDPVGPDDGYSTLADAMATARAGNTEHVARTVGLQDAAKLEAWGRILDAHAEGGRFDDDPRMQQLRGFVNEVAATKRADADQRDAAAEQYRRDVDERVRQRQAEQGAVDERRQQGEQAAAEQRQQSEAARRAQRARDELARREAARPRVATSSQAARGVAEEVTGGRTRLGLEDDPADLEAGGYLDERGRLVVTDPERLSFELDNAAAHADEETHFLEGRDLQRMRQRRDTARRMSEQVRAMIPVDDSGITPETRERVRGMSSDELDEAMAGAGDDYDQLLAAVAESDRRERLEERRIARDHRGRRFDELVEQGWSEEDAADEAYGVTREGRDADEAIERLRAEGYRGTFHQMAKASFYDEVERIRIRLEDNDNPVKGQFLNREGRARGLDPGYVFTSSAEDARRYASEELADWWRYNGRLSLREWKAMLAGDGEEAARIRRDQGDFGADSAQQVRRPRRRRR